MAYTVEDIAELVRYHLVAAAPSDEVADGNLINLMHNVKQMIATFGVDETLYWMVCEDCGAWVSSELIGPDGAGESDGGGFYCTSCRFGEANWTDGSPHPRRCPVFYWGLGISTGRM